MVTKGRFGFRKGGMGGVNLRGGGDWKGLNFATVDVYIHIR